jgi:hypothetical protein
MQQLGYFGGGVGRVPGAEEIPEPRVNWLCLRHFLLPDFVCLRIVSCRRCCRSLGSKFIS